MSTIPVTSAKTTPRRDASSSTHAFHALTIILRPMGSLKIAVGSFAAAIVLILIGTLAQVNRDIWEVMEVYFKSTVAWVDIMVFFPRSWFPLLEARTASFVFAGAMLGTSCLAAGLTWANEKIVRHATWWAGAILVLGIAISLSALLAGGFWYPGGAMIGGVMCINLAAAHLTRYPIRADGRRLILGLVTAVVGIVVTWLVVTSGHNTKGFQGEPPIGWTTLWQWTKVGLSAIALALFAFAIFGRDQRRFVRPITGGTGILLGLLSTWLWAAGEAAYMGDSGMRILWQLMLGTLAGIVLLAAGICLFRQRAGVVVLHAGIGLMMFGGWFVSKFDVEEQMTIAEGASINYGRDIRSVELAVIRRNSPDHNGQDDVWAIPLLRNGRPTRFLEEEQIKVESLPFEIKILEFDRSSTVEMNRDNADIPVNDGQNQGFKIAPAKPATGAMGDSVDLSGGYFQIVNSKTGQPVGTYLLSQESFMMRGGQMRQFDTEEVALGDDVYDIQLRFERNYKDYTVELIDVRKDDYIGTNIPRNYSSEIHLTDPQRGVDQTLTIWMNNPRRYAGETFYQSGWQQDPFGTEYTTLQVVTNHGWMIPYVSCMIVVVGMLYHFMLILLRFLDRQTRPVAKDANDQALAPPTKVSWGKRLTIPLATVVLFGLFVMRVAQPPRTEPGELDLAEFGTLPMVYQGRVKPFDTLARNSLRSIADAETFKGILPPDELEEAWPKVVEELKEKYPSIQDADLTPFKSGNTRGLIELIDQESDADYYAIASDVESRLFKRQPAVRWLLDVITGSEQARRHQVIRIYHPQVLDLLNLKRRKYYRYSLEEIMANLDEFQSQVEQAVQLAQGDMERLSLYQKKLLEVDRKVRTVLNLHRAFSPPQLPPLPSATELQSDRDAAMSKMAAFREAMRQMTADFERLQPPLVIAPTNKDEDWEAYAMAYPVQVLGRQFLGQDFQSSFQYMNDIMLAYLDNDAKAFNSNVEAYQQQLQENPPKELQVKPTWANEFIESRFGSFYAFESAFNRVSPFVVLSFLYVLAFALLCLGWLKYRTTFNRIAYWLLVCIFVAHTIALMARIYISGRPPVTNLYSSAVFIGWGVVLLALLIELFYRNGLASLAASADGFITLLIAHKLAADGDTFQVLQAVLDTQFWLATHVVCITFGYATTFLAGGMGLIYILRGVFTPSLNKQASSELTRMTYGVVCFSIFFSFFGTVLGGLWADDSWGRFWGWDPKENGALIIVLWNALILHARWDRMIADRGLAVLAVLGNVVTAWSWFGVNELGVGLHSYGFTEGRLRTLALAVLAHLVVVAIGWLPLSMWWSQRRQGTPST